jgi:hypothetical protein
MPATKAAIVPAMNPVELDFLGCSQACCSRIWSMMDGIPATSLDAAKAYRIGVEPPLMPVLPAD